MLPVPFFRGSLFSWFPGCDWQNGDCFVVKDASPLVTWQDGRCDAHFLSSLPAPDSHLAVATGFGCATTFWYSRNRWVWADLRHGSGTAAPDDDDDDDDDDDPSLMGVVS